MNITVGRAQVLSTVYREQLAEVRAKATNYVESDYFAKVNRLQDTVILIETYIEISRDIERQLLKAVEPQDTKRAIKEIENDNYNVLNDTLHRVALLEKEVEIQKLKVELEKEKNNVKEKIVYVPRYENPPVWPWHWWDTNPKVTYMGIYAGTTGSATTKDNSTTTVTLSGASSISAGPKDAFSNTTTTKWNPDNMHPCASGTADAKPKV